MAQGQGEGEEQREEQGEGDVEGRDQQREAQEQEAVAAQVSAADSLRVGGQPLAAEQHTGGSTEQTTAPRGGVLAAFGAAPSSPCPLPPVSSPTGTSSGATCQPGAQGPQGHDLQRDQQAAGSAGPAELPSPSVPGCSSAAAAPAMPAPEGLQMHSSQQQQASGAQQGQQECVPEVAALLQQAEQLSDRGHYRASSDVCTSVIAMQPAAAEAYEQRAGVYNKLNRFREALEDASTALALRPGCLVALLASAAARESLGDVQVGSAA